MSAKEKSKLLTELFELLLDKTEISKSEAFRLFRQDYIVAFVNTLSDEEKKMFPNLVF